MRKEYDFSQARKNPYAKRLKKQITIRVDDTTIEYFKSLAGDVGISYQNLINFFLRQCALEKKKPVLKWEGSGEQTARFDARSRSRKSA